MFKEWKGVVMSGDERLSYLNIAPEGIGILSKLERYVNSCGLEPGLIGLVKLRVSQINRCEYCIDLYAREARLRGESEERLQALSEWRKTGCFTDREREALLWATTVTKIGDSHVPAEAYAQILHYFKQKELVDLTLAVISANAWNRVIVSFRSLPVQPEAPNAASRPAAPAA